MVLKTEARQLADLIFLRLMSLRILIFLRKQKGITFLFFLGII